MRMPWADAAADEGSLPWLQHRLRSIHLAIYTGPMETGFQRAGTKVERDQVVCLLGTVPSTRAGNQSRLRGQFASREKHVSDKDPMK